MRSPVSHPRIRSIPGLAIGVIGCGKMGQALLKGLMDCGVPRQRLRSADPDAAARRAVSRRLRLLVNDDNAAVVRRSNVLILAVKPQQLSNVIAEIAPSLTRRHLVISIAAGITLGWLRRRLRGIPLVRVMPNLPATVGCGFSAITYGSGVSRRQRTIAKAIFEAVGIVAELPERYFDAVTAVSGSGPAYVFFLIHAWEEAARALGLPPAVAERAIRETLAGSACLLQGSGEPALSLMKQVASKGGTTEAALSVLAKRRVESHFREALRAAAHRSHQLSWS